MNTMNELEAAVIDMLLAGERPALACLRTQRQRMRVERREYTGVGFFTEFRHPDDVVRLPSSRRIRFGDVHADIDGLAHGAGFLLFIDNGLITMLEGYTYGGESWRKEPVRFELRYLTPVRDLSPFEVK